jgi:hypothetical protein
MPHSCERARTVKAHSDLLGLRQQSVALESEHELARGTHRPHGVGAGGTDPHLENIEYAQSHIPNLELATAQTPERLSIVLVRAFVRAWGERRGDPHSLREFGAPSFACRTLDITASRFGRRTTTRWDSGHRALEFDSTPDECHHVARADFARGFHALAVEMYFATGDSLGGEGTGFEQPDAKQPPVDACGSRTVFCAIFGHEGEYN